MNKIDPAIYSFSQFRFVGELKDFRFFFTKRKCVLFYFQSLKNNYRGQKCLVWNVARGESNVILLI